MSEHYYVAVANNGYRNYFTYTPKYEGEIPALTWVVHPQDYEVFEVTEEEYRKNVK